MAIIKNGVNGTVSGKAGSVVFVLTKTGNYVRSLPRVKNERLHLNSCSVEHASKL
ncbi:hypothetical protein KUH03_18555 [Sphingobacterium sp. E70]|uniref:hypothetical protein n=1 Tax=Sphingobacterium sp. E70 TaxID=2853439 RepID=UPI00211BEAFC|nr:hypothetical protein [Sphingobacterium sp. E70]ULT28386.1 hypothetical protein KUH03_18555 [Sphingobacterium sp. E70]